MSGSKMSTRTAEMHRCARHPLVPVTQETFHWRGVQCRPDAVYKTGGALLVVTAATGTDPYHVSPFDRQNAELAAVVVARSMGWDREVRALLRFPQNTVVEVSVSTHGLGRRVSDCAKSLRSAVGSNNVPSAIITYVLAFMKRVL